ncbi:MAG: class I SAM-dependent RNA methyltransferase [Myxococcales bacterium]|nr:class I SAM-dependent RNA methyltransferase [Myxococcales bacterium]MCB9753528.1 class I SAM-dependent RNA methyltransferase [Myxococcales bacterium]
MSGVNAVEQEAPTEPVRIFGVAHGGAGVGRRINEADGATVGEHPETRTWLVDGALPGEIVQVRRTQTEKRLIRGVTATVAMASEQRVSPPCPLSETCGGCNWQHVAPAAQLELKRQIVQGQLRRFDVEVEAAAPSPSALGYRRRARLHYEQTEDGQWRLGFRRARSHEIVDVPRCAVLDAPLQHAAERVRGLLPLLPARGEILGLSDGERAALGLPGVRLTDALTAALAGVLDDVLVGFSVRGGRQRQAIGRAKLEIDGPQRDGEPVPILVSPFVFTQAQGAVNRALVRYVTAQAEPAGARVLELYAGAGNFTRALAGTAKRVWAIDESREAIACLQGLVERFGLPVTARNGKSEGFLGKLARADRARGHDYDVVVLDPPRRGLGRQPARWLASTRPARVVYVSCDPATLARDLEVFVKSGYTLERVRVFDLMPMTSEVEIVATLRRRKKEAGA